MRRNYLFCTGDLAGTFRNHFATLGEHVDAIPERDLLEKPEDSLVEPIMRELEIAPLVLHEDRQSLTREESRIDVSGDRSRYFSVHQGPFYVPAIRLVISIPFDGDPLLWKLKPNHWSSVVPYGEVEPGYGNTGGTLELVVEYPADQAPEKAKQMFDENMQQIRFYLDSQRRQVDQENAKLPSIIRSAIAARKARVQQHRDGLEKAFGFAITPATPRTMTADIGPAKRPATGRPKSVSSEVSWDVFLSHASEDKDDFARPLASALRDAGLRVWFDEFTLRVGDSLRRSIDRGLGAAKFGIVLISPHFLQKEWPQKELDALVGREFDGKKVILPVWHKVDAQLVRKYSPLLADRLASSTSRGLAKVVDDLLVAIRGN